MRGAAQYVSCFVLVGMLVRRGMLRAGDLVVRPPQQELVNFLKASARGAACVRRCPAPARDDVCCRCMAGAQLVFCGGTRGPWRRWHGGATVWALVP